jgi:DNA invertase Pin-like site-specific DNA recombinase
MSKVYGYCRVALADREAMTEQMALIDVYCQRHDLKIEKYFCDNGVSGLILDRKGLNELLKVLQDGDTVVVRDIARLSRSYSQCISIIEQMKDLDIELKIIK